MLLAFDTATSAVTVALHDGDAVVAESTVVDARRHGELLMPGIRRVLAEAGVSPRDLSRIAVGVGPGPFTGLRVGIVTARTMAAVLQIPIVAVCTLDVLAAAVRVEGPFAVATDARRKEVYWAEYDAWGRRVVGPVVDKPAALLSDGRVAGRVAGRGALLYPDAFPLAVAPEHPSAAEMARIVHAGTVEVLAPEPLYLRRPDAVEPAARKRAVTTYRAGGPGDRDAIVALEAQTFGVDAWSQESVADELAGVGTTRHVIVAVDGDQLVGYASLMHVSEVGDVQRVVVPAAHRRRGIAGALLRRLLDEAASRGCEQVLLEVAADNSAALGLYTSLGFAEISRRLHYYADNVDAVVLALHLPRRQDGIPTRHNGRDG